MKSTESFKQTIEAKLQEMAAADPLFAKSLKKEGKNLDACINYILNTVQKSGCHGFTDEEIFGMAAHYYDEDKIEVGKAVNCTVVVNHTVELTPEELKTAKEKAIRKTIAEEQARLRKPVIVHKKEEPTQVSQPTLF